MENRISGGVKRECHEELRDENGGRSLAGCWKEVQRPECEPMGDVFVTPRDPRTAAARQIVDELTPDGFTCICAPNPAPGFPTQATLRVGLCLSVVAGEERAHHGYAVRDLAVLETRT